jgi:hypothetical protein
MAIVVTAPRTVDNTDITELHALEKCIKITSEGDPDYFYYGGESNYILDEAAVDDERCLQSSLILHQSYGHNLGICRNLLQDSS